LLPFDFARTFGQDAADGLDIRCVEATVGQFASDHPYLLFDRAAIARIRQIAGTNPKLRARFARSLGESARRSGPRDVRSMVKERARRLITTAFVALIADDWRKEEALTASRSMLVELSSAASWRERPVIRSFLDCGETAVAVAFAYDWLYDRLSTDERQSIEQALLFHILDPASVAFEDESLLWPRRRDNCCVVSNCAIMIAALAVFRRHPSLASSLVRHSLASAWNAFAAFAPDGAWTEGLSYWSLAARYAGLMVAALESTLGDSFGLVDRPGFASTGDFALHATGPFGAAFDFGDSVRRFDVAALAWLAYRFGRPVDGWLLGDYDGWHLPFAMIWPAPGKAAPAELDLPTGKVFYSADLACFRNTWRNDAGGRPVYLAIKGGNARGFGPSSSEQPEDTLLHSQADAGGFIVDGARHRWVIDLGGDDYDLPGYFDHGADGRTGRRWRYYRVRTEGHNTLVIDGHNQDPRARATILGSSVEGGSKWVVYDLSAAYGKPAGSVRRGAALLGRQVVIEDEIDPRVSGKIVWTMHTTAEPVCVSGAFACFRRGEDRLVARILEPADARFELTLPPAPRRFSLGDVRQLHGRPQTVRRGARIRELPRRDDDGERRGAGALIRRLQIELPTGTRRLTVLLLPDCDDAEDTAPPVTPLDYWLARRPVRLAPWGRSTNAKKRRRSLARGVAMKLTNAMIEHPVGAAWTGADHG
jgi:Heparinase II/III-like protein